MNQLCPKCRVSMETITVQDIEVERCTACGGVWFDLLEHRRLRDVPHAAEQIDTHERVARVETNAAKAACPRCHVALTHMRDVDERTVQYDYCAVCNGTFFDAGEFRKYANDGPIARLRSLLHRERDGQKRGE